MNLLTTYGIQLSTYISVEKIGYKTISHKSFRPVIIWEIRSESLLFISDLNLPLTPRLQLGFDIWHRNVSVFKASGTLAGKEVNSNSSVAYMYEALLHRDGEYLPDIIIDLIQANMQSDHAKSQAYEWSGYDHVDNVPGQLLDVLA